MANNSTGKWVQRAATTGGGRTYRGQMPVNFYAALAVIIIVGLGLVGLSRYQLTHGTTNSSGPPTSLQTWYAGLAVDVCGTIQPNLPASTNGASTGLTANGNGVVTIHPKDTTESGSNATLGRFVGNYKGLQLTNSLLQYPGKQVHNNGDICPKGTPDAGKPGVVIAYSWPNFTAKHGSQTPGDPQKLPFQNGQLITMAFVPAGTNVPKPPSTVITSLITADQAGPTTPTSAPTITSTPPIASATLPTRTPTTAPTTAPSGTTATTAAGGTKA